MDNSRTYRRYAAQCIDMANDAAIIKEQGLLYEMAKVWLQVAEDTAHMERGQAIRARWQGSGPIEKLH